jgi:hypothetical protein
MTIKLNSLARWSKLDSDKGIAFAGNPSGERRVRLNVNCEAVTTFFLAQGKTQTLLCTVQPGLETIEFNTSGDFHVFAEKGSGVVMYQSADLESTHAEIVDPVIFTRIANRRHRNPELEEIMYRMQLNMERRLAQQSSEIEQAFARRLKEETDGRAIEQVKTDAPGAAAPTGQPEVPEQKSDSPKPVKDTGKQDETKPAAGTGDKPE